MVNVGEQQRTANVERGVSTALAIYTNYFTVSNQTFAFPPFGISNN